MPRKDINERLFQTSLGGGNASKKKGQTKLRLTRSVETRIRQRKALSRAKDASRCSCPWAPDISWAGNPAWLRRSHNDWALRQGHQHSFYMGMGFSSFYHSTVAATTILKLTGNCLRIKRHSLRLPWWNRSHVSEFLKHEKCNLFLTESSAPPFSVKSASPHTEMWQKASSFP